MFNVQKQLLKTSRQILKKDVGNRFLVSYNKNKYVLFDISQCNIKK